MIRWRNQIDQDIYNNLLIPVIKQRPTTLFVGAGLSYHAGYPLLNDLIKLLHNEALRRNNSLVLNGDWKNKAQLCKNELGEDYSKILISRFNPDNNKLRFTSIHANLIRIRCNSIITTNYDSCIELAYSDSGMIKKPNYYPYLYKSELCNNSIHHIHGYIDPEKPLESVRTVILTSDEFTNAYKKSDILRGFLVTLFSEQNVIFLGFNVDDDLLFGILRIVMEIKRENRKITDSMQLPPINETIHFAILDNHAVIDKEYFKREEQNITKEELEEKLINRQDDDLRSLGVISLRYNSDEFHKDVENIIVELRDVTTPIKPSASEVGDSK